MVTLPKAERGKIRFTVVAEAPIAAPVKKGQKIGKLRIDAPDMQAQYVPLLAASDAGKAGFFRRMWLNMKNR